MIELSPFPPHAWKMRQKHEHVINSNEIQSENPAILVIPVHFTNTHNTFLKDHEKKPRNLTSENSPDAVWLQQSKKYSPDENCSSSVNFWVLRRHKDSLPRRTPMHLVVKTCNSTSCHCLIHLPARGQATMYRPSSSAITGSVYRFFQGTFSTSFPTNTKPEGYAEQARGSTPLPTWPTALVPLPWGKEESDI